MTRADLVAVLPEAVLALFALTALMWGAFGGRDRIARPLLYATAAMLALLALWIGSAGSGARPPSAACSSTTPSPASPR